MVGFSGCCDWSCYTSNEDIFLKEFGKERNGAMD